MGAVVIRGEYPARSGERLVLSSFVQPAALAIQSIRAHAASESLPVEPSVDERGFGRWMIRAPRGADVVVVDYVVRPGSREEAGMSGPTGYRLGYLDRQFGLLAGRQLFLLPGDPSALGRIHVEFLLPEEATLVTPWEGPDRGTVFDLDGGDAASRLVKTLFGVGQFEEAASEGGRFRVFVSTLIPEKLLRATLRRATALEEYLASVLGRPRRPLICILVPKAPDADFIAVDPEPVGFGLSVGDGIPSRWLVIGRILAEALLADRLAAVPETDASYWVLQALPTFLTLRFSEMDGWRSRQAWYEEIYYDTAALDLNDPGHQPDPVKRASRVALVLDRLTAEMASRGSGSVEDYLRHTLGKGKDLDWDRFKRRVLRDDLRSALDPWLAPGPHTIPFPGSAADDQPARIAAPPSVGSLPRRLRQVDLYFGSQSLGLLEQCGCRSKQLGGMARKATVLRRALRSSPGSRAFELGNAVPFDEHAPRLDRQKSAEADLALSLLSSSGMTASLVGHAELSYGLRFLEERIARLPGGFRMSSSNVEERGVQAAIRTDTSAGPITLVGVLDVDSYDLGRPLEFEDSIASVRIRDPILAIHDVLRDRVRGGPVIAAGTLKPSTVLRIHQSFPEISMIVTDDYFHFEQDPRIRFERPMQYSTLGMLDRSLLVVLKEQAYGLAHLRLAFDGAGRVAAADLQDILLDEQVPDAPDVRARIDRHYARLAAESGLPLPAPIGTSLRERLQGTYAGASACARCHPAETSQWKKTPHASAFATMLEKRRQGVPGCYACHVTGYRQPGGYARIEDLGLRHVQCEACHGPGSRHLIEPGAGNIMRAPTASVCKECHTSKHSDMNAENFQEYWSKIVHGSRPGGRAAADRRTPEEGWEAAARDGG